MRALVVLCLVAACGDNGLLLEIEPGDKNVTSVEVFIADVQMGMHMGLPMATSKTGGSVWEVAEHVTAAVAGDTTSILLKPGSLTDAPTILVLGYDANHDAIRFAQLPAVSFPYTHSDTIKVPLDKITEVPAAGSTTGTPTGAKLVRWSKTPDDNTGNCIAVLTDNGAGRYGGDFFGPGDDLDCDQASPDCDPTWYLKTPPANGSGAGSGDPFCARDDRLDTPPGVCRVGTTIACTDNVGDCAFAGSTTVAPPCAPAVLCDRCTDQIDMDCLDHTIRDSNSFHVECTIPAGLAGSNGMTFCDGDGAPFSVPIDPMNGTPFTCYGPVQFWPVAFDAARTELVLNSVHTASLTAICGQGSPTIQFTLQEPNMPIVDPQPMDTEGVMQVTTVGAAPGSLLIPLIVHLDPSCNGPPSCMFVPGPSPDTMWQCLGP